MPFYGNPNRGYLDTKSFRLCILEKANLRLGIIVSSINDKFYTYSGIWVPYTEDIPFSSAQVYKSNQISLIDQNEKVLEIKKIFKNTDSLLIVNSVSEVSREANRAYFSSDGFLYISVINPNLSKISITYVISTESTKNGTYINKESGILALLDSSYKAEVPSTVYALHLKNLAYESARYLCSTQQVVDDIIFNTTRGEYLSQNIASFLFPNDNRFADSESSDEKSRSFYLSIIEAYFGGSTKENIQKSLYKFLGVPVVVKENFLDARTSSAVDSEIKKFTFDVNLNLEDPRIKDVTKLQNEINFLLNIIKPAHTNYETKLIFSEGFDVFRKGCTLVTDPSGNPVITHDGFETKIKKFNTSICDTFHIDSHDYYYEDLRKESSQKNSIYIGGEIAQRVSPTENDVFQASPRLVKSLDGNSWQITSKDIFHTRFGPLGTKYGQLATIVDVQVFVNGIQATISEIWPLSGAFRLSITPNDDDLVTVNYYYLKDYIYSLITNDFDSVINSYGNQATEFNYKSVLFPTNYVTQQDVIPIELEYKYKGFHLFNSSILNDSLTLNYNSLGLRNRLNDAYVFKSLGYDSDIYSTKLNEDTPLVPISLDKKDVFRRLPFQEFRLNNDEFIMNNREDRLFGEIHYESYHPFYSALQLDSKDNGGQEGFLHSIFEDAVSSITISVTLGSSGAVFDEYINKLGKEYDCQLYTYPSETTVNDEDCVLFGGNATWTDTTPYFGGNHGQMHMLLSDITQENINDLEERDAFITNISDLKADFYKCFETYPANPDIALLNDTTSTLIGSKVKESEIEIDYTTVNTGIIPFLMSPYVPYLNPGAVLAQIVPIKKELKFLAPRKIFTLFLEGSCSITSTGITPNYPITSDYVPTGGYYKLSTDLSGTPYEVGPFSWQDSATVIQNTINSFLISLGVFPSQLYVTVTGNWSIGLNLTLSGTWAPLVGPMNYTPIGDGLIYKIQVSTPITRITNIRGIVYQDYDLTGLNIINESLIELDATNPINISIGLQDGDIIEAEYDAIDYMNQYDQYVQIYNDPRFLTYSDYFNNHLFSNIDITDLNKVTNFTKGYEYSLTRKDNVGAYLFQEETYYLYPEYFDVQIKPYIDPLEKVKSIYRITNITKGYAYNLDDMIIKNNVAFINKNKNLGKSLDITDSINISIEISHFIIDKNRTILINKVQNSGKLLDLNDIIFIEGTSLNTEPSPQPTLSRAVDNYLITKIEVQPL